ncbi:quinone oxidoreductase 1 [Heterobasidion irregulare TC 32-1]|uniref:Probable quinone oxidoreductase n=1 Tax=Heterobasidion irregulare (strain TC 32-1) TaxID=747525 RepID=W4KLT6_HETIT|nr:quinone oxidoreductase 1 [Heterobasidion irregulare TC 32-1]ETW86788.1 quinone oxidoreductase 1 [Heterobasidion irregulare TC 32-1]
MSYPSTVKAVAIAKTGGFEVIEDMTLPFPEQKPGDVLVKVQYAGVNFIDTYFRAGVYPTPFLPFHMAKEISGVIAELPKDEATLNNEVYKKRNLRKGDRIAADLLGGLQEYVTVPWDAVYPIPKDVSNRVAAAALLQGITALSLMTESHNVQKGETILIHTVAGGVGLLMAQVAKARGATVIGTTSTPEKAELAKAHGADHVILYKNENTVERVSQLTNGQGPHVIYDGVGKDTFEDDLKMIRRKGTLISFGNASGLVPPFSIVRLNQKNLKLLRPTETNYTVTLEEREYYGAQLFDLISKGDLKVNIFGDYPFTAKGVRQAQLDLTGGKTTGKLIVKVSDE